MQRFLAPTILTLALFAVVLCKAQSVKLSLHDNWSFTVEGEEAWLGARVPGSVHMDLYRNNKIGDPFYRMNEKDLQWIERENWRYRTEFTVGEDIAGKDRIDLVFEGLDTYATVTLNGVEVLEANNMFRGWRVNVEEILRGGSNTLEIVFRSPIDEVMPRYEALGYEIPVSDNDQAEKKVSVYTRKAGYHYGWDWGPRFVTCGIWKPVYLEAWNTARIDDLFIEQLKIGDQHAALNAHVELTVQSGAKAGLEIRVDDQVASKTEISLVAGCNTLTIPFSIEDPVRWWPNGLGEQHMYDIEAVLTAGGDVLSESGARIGLRTVEIVREPDERGHAFYFKVNGVPVFMKGANYIPQDNFLSRVTRGRYDHILESAKNAHMNMIRVWGGGIYEKKVFYDLCDEKGLLVWQDFMFACAMLPFHEDFLQNIREEAVYNVKRLRNHPSIALWCGNNESLSAWFRWGWKERYDRENPVASEELWHGYQKIFYEILPWAVAKYDGGKFYWPSSPSSSYTEPESLNSGDMHYWNVWHGKQPYEEYENNAGRFLSEYGFQAFPPFETVKTYTIPEDYDIESEVMLSHQRHPVGNQLIREYMQRDFREPRDFESFLYVSNVLQANIIKYAIEGFRRSMPHTMGSLYWQLDDCWPVASWSGIDYYGRWKAMHYAAMHAYSPLLTAPKVVDGAVHFYIVSDHLEPVQGRLLIHVYDLEGRLLKDLSESVTISENTSRIYRKHTVEALTGDRKKDEVFIYTAVETDEGKVTENTTYLVKPKMLNFVKANVKYDLEQVNDGFRLTLRSKRYAPKVFLSVTEGTNFSDNYFDLVPGMPKTVTYRTTVPGREFERRLKIMTLGEAF